jgi:hypothetical protein
MSDPYEKKLVNLNFYHSKSEIKAKIIVVLDGKLENRGLNLIHPISRVFPEKSIIELIATDDKEAAPGKVVDNIAYVGFAELQNGGVLLSKDEIYWNGKYLGSIIGFDDTHMPNHQNTIINVKKRVSGKKLGMKIGDEIIIKGFIKK